MYFPRPLITVAQLFAWMGSQELVIADCRFDLADPEAGRMAYHQGHLPSAVYFHLDEELSGPIGLHGGRHPLPEPSALAARFGAAGIGPGVKVVAYDDGGPYAARLWWLLRWLGHDAVSVLDGGYKAWVAAGGPVTTALPTPTPRTLTPHPLGEMVADMAEVRDRPPGSVVLDARSPQRFAGEPHPLDEKAGHMPGAINRFWQESLTEGGFWRPAGEQRARFAGLPTGPAVIHSCGSGVSACANLLAMEIAGLSGSRLYPGSWSDWCSYPENPVER